MAVVFFSYATLFGVSVRDGNDLGNRTHSKFLWPPRAQQYSRLDQEVVAVATTRQSLGHSCPEMNPLTYGAKK